MSQALASLRDKHTYVSNALDKQRERLASIIPHGFALDAPRALGVALDALTRNPKLLECEPKSIVRSVMHAAAVGLPIGGPLGEAYFVPFRGECTMMIGYRGLAELVRRSPRVRLTNSILVREADDFEVDEARRRIRHTWGKGNEKQRGDVVYCYSLVTYEKGPHDEEAPHDFEVMSRDEILAIRKSVIDRSHGRDTPWKGKDELEMWRKCPVRRHAKMLELSPLARHAVERDDLESMRRGELGHFVGRDGTFESGRVADLKNKLDEEARTIDAELVDDGGTT